MDVAPTNGGFPLPLEGEPVRVLACHHAVCDGDTRVRLPLAVPSRAVRRVMCDVCAEPYEPTRVADAEAPTPPAGRSRSLSLPSPSLPSISLPSPSLSWRWVSLPVAGIAVVAILLALQGDDDQATTTAPAVAGAGQGPTADRPERDGGQARVPGDAQLISESTFQLALPAGWERTAPSGGATFAAVAPDGDADVMLWIEHDPKLDFATFEARSLDQLESLAGSAGVVRRNPGPTPETTTSVIAPTSAPSGAPNYEVLISGGPGSNWYYLATTSQPGSAAESTEGIELVQGSFLPQGGRG